MASGRHARRAKRTLVASTALVADPDFELSLHEVPRHLATECQLVFPQLRECEQRHTSESARRLLAVPTMHRAAVGILQRNEQTEAERLRVFLQFSHFANVFRVLLRRRDPDAFVDYVALEGAGAIGGSGAIFDEVSSTKALLGHRVKLYMGVPIIVHPRWGFNRLALHTIVLFGDPRDAADVLGEMAESYRCGVHRGVAEDDGEL